MYWTLFSQDAKDFDKITGLLQSKGISQFLIIKFFTKHFPIKKKKKKTGFTDSASVGNTMFHTNNFAKKFKYNFFMSPNVNFNFSGGNPF